MTRYEALINRGLVAGKAERRASITMLATPKQMLAFDLIKVPAATDRVRMHMQELVVSVSDE
jgi:hypothetical protein